MILVRNVFQLKFGKSREALEFWKEGLGLLKKVGAENSRILTDAVAPFYTLVLESTYPGLAEFENFHKKATSNAHWKKWYEKFVPLVDSGRREIFNIVE